MKIEGLAVVIPGDDLDTDVMYPGAYLNLNDPHEMKLHLFEGLDDSLRDLLGQGDAIMVTGSNFGIGSSREHVPLAMKALGVRCVVGKSFARIFRRNCINIGLPLFECEGAARAARPGSPIQIDVTQGSVTVDGAAFAARPAPEFVLELQRLGGLVAWAQDRLRTPAAGGVEARTSPGREGR